MGGQHLMDRTKTKQTIALRDLKPNHLHLLPKKAALAVEDMTITEMFETVVAVVRHGTTDAEMRDLMLCDPHVMVHYADDPLLRSNPWRIKYDLMLGRRVVLIDDDEGAVDNAMSIAAPALSELDHKVVDLRGVADLLVVL